MNVWKGFNLWSVLNLVQKTFKESTSLFKDWLYCVPEKGSDTLVRNIYDY